MRNSGMGASVVAVLIVLSLALGAHAGNPTATAEFINQKGQTIGSAHLEQGPNGTLIRLSLDGLADKAGFHGIHIHQHGDCSDPDQGFMASGGHHNPDGMHHGLMHPEGPDAGDFPNIYVHEDGMVRAELFTNHATLDGAVGARMLDETGAALVIHAHPDDHFTQPIGKAGPRIACGVIVPVSGAD